MMVRFIARALGAAALASLALVHSAQAQPQPPQPSASAAQPSAAAVALAAQLLEIKGGLGAFDPAINGVITHHKNTLQQINPNVGKTLDEIERGIRAESPARLQELHNELARGYASQFAEQDLKDLIAFYKTPLGKKLIDSEPKAGEEATKRVQVWIEKYAETVSTKMRAELKKKGYTEF
jgi:hypothetical protein